MREIRTTLEDLRVKASGLRRVAIWTTGLILANWLVHRVLNGAYHIDDNSISDTTMLAIPAITAELINRWRKRENVAREIDRAGALFSDADSHASVGEQLQQIHRTKNLWATALDPGLSAKCFLLFGRAPESESRHAALEAISQREALLRDTPLLDPVDALRIMRVIAPVSDELNEKIDSAPDAPLWDAKIEQLRDRMTHARFLMSAQREEYAGSPVAPVSLRYADVPTQDQISTYFFLTGAVPPESATGTALQLTVDRIRKVDPTLPRRVALRLINARTTRDPILPLRPHGDEPWRTFPIARPGGDPEAEGLYLERLESVMGFRDSFVGQDGWHYMLFRGAHDGIGRETVVAARDVVRDGVPALEATRLTGRIDDVTRWWELMKMDRAAHEISILEPGAAWRPAVSEALRDLRATAAAVHDPLTFTWPSALSSAPWAQSLENRDAWLAALEPVPRIALSSRPRRHLATRGATRPLPTTRLVRSI